MGWRKILRNARVLRYTGCSLLFHLFIFFYQETRQRELSSYVAFTALYIWATTCLGSDNYLKSLPEWCRCFVSGLTQWRITDARGLMDCVYSTKSERCTHSFDHSTPFSRIRMISWSSSPSKVNFSPAREAAFLLFDNENGLNSRYLLAFQRYTFIYIWVYKYSSLFSNFIESIILMLIQIFNFKASFLS